jgi:hypothetical protein
LDVVFYQKGTDPACQEWPFNIECTGITESEGILEKLGIMGEYTIFAGNHTWDGGAGLSSSAVQVGLGEDWSVSLGIAGIRVNATIVWV